MGRAKSNTKRRPKGKRGWRKIVVNPLENPSQEISFEQQQHKIEKSRDSQLWKQDTAPRKSKKLSKAQTKLLAKEQLLAVGFTINSTESNNTLNQQIKKYKKQRRLSAFKQARKEEKYGNKHTQPKQTTFITFSNGNYKKIQLDNHPNIKQNKNRIDYHKNNPYHLYKIRHDRKNTKNARNRDLWDNKKAHSSKHVENNFVSDMNYISLPHSGESINPLSHQYYRSKWKSLQLRAKQLFVRKYQSQRTQKWYKNLDVNIDEGAEEEIEQLNKNAQEMKELYLKHLRLYKQQRSNGAVEVQNGAEDKLRQISRQQMINDLKSNRKNANKRRKATRKRVRFSAKTGGHIFGPKYRFKKRATRTMKGDKLNNCLRNTLDSGVDHPLSFMFQEMRKQNKIHGQGRNRFVFPKQKGFLGPRYKVQTRIGKLHHANVGHRYFKGRDDL